MYYFWWVSFLKPLTDFNDDVRRNLAAAPSGGSMAKGADGKQLRYRDLVAA